MNTVRVALASMPPILIGILRNAMEGERGIQIVAQFENFEDLMEEVETKRVDVAIVGESSPDDVSRPARLLSTNPKLRVLTIAPTDGSANRYELYVGRERLGEVATTTVADLIRSQRPLAASEVELLCRGSA